MRSITERMGQDNLINTLENAEARERENQSQEAVEVAPSSSSVLASTINDLATNPPRLGTRTAGRARTSRQPRAPKRQRIAPVERIPAYKAIRIEQAEEEDATLRYLGC